MEQPVLNSWPANCGPFLYLHSFDGILRVAPAEPGSSRCWLRSCATLFRFVSKAGFWGVGGEMRLGGAGSRGVGRSGGLQGGTSAIAQGVAPSTNTANAIDDCLCGRGAPAQPRLSPHVASRRLRSVRIELMILIMRNTPSIADRRKSTHDGGGYPADAF